MFNAAPTRLPLAVILLSVALSAQARDRADVSLDARATVYDNFYFQDEAEQSATGILLAPRLRLLRDAGRSETELELEGEGGVFSTNEADNYFDFSARGGVTGRLGYNAISAGIAYQADHDPFGAVRTEGAGGPERELDQWNRLLLRAQWARFANIKGSFFHELGVIYSQREYTTNRESTRFLDRSGSTINGLVGLMLTAKTGVFLSGFVADVDFDEERAGQERSGTTQAVQLGMRWDVSAQTTGDVRVGVAQRDSDDSPQEADSAYWQAILQWDPSRVDTLSFETRRAYSASYDVNARFFDERTHRFNWRHRWNRRLSSDLSASLLEREFVGRGDEDDYMRLGANVNLALDSSLAVFGAVNYSERDSTRTGLDYEALTGTVGMRAQLN